MTGLHIERPCRVRKAVEDRWERTCLYSPAVWPCTSREATWEAAQNAAAHHMTTAHPVAGSVLAAVIDLAAYRTTKLAAGGQVLQFVRPRGGAA